MAQAPKLKVFCAPVGFYDAVIAAPSQKAALAAWGTTTNLFASGDATVVEDPALQAEALARPGEIIKKSRGDVAAMLGPKPAKVAAVPKVGVRPSKPPQRPDRSKLYQAERALSAAEREFSAELSSLAEERAELEEREQELRTQGEARLEKLCRAKDDAASAYAKAEGRR